MPRTPTANTLFYGDNLTILRDYIEDESVDLVYLDPPFNSNATYNVLFKAPGGEGSQAQIEAFGDTWHWNMSAERAYDEVLKSGNSDAASMLSAMRSFLGDNDMMAYLAMMAVRLIELYRVLRTTGSLYLHCDPVASHYLKAVLDAVFGTDRMLNEISWKRTHSHGSSKRFGPVHDVILYYSKSEEFTWTNPTVEHSENYVEEHFRNFDEARQERFQAISLTGAGTRRGESGGLWRSIDPTAVGRHWALPKLVLEREGIPNGSTQSKLDQLDEAGRIYWPRSESGTPRLKWFVSDLDGVSIGDVWTDIPPISAHAKERLGYPTQKPLALLERIIAASSNEGELVLDPFCGCGTTVHAAQKLNRRWIGIDITHLAVGLIRRRLQDAFPLAAFKVEGVPKDIAGAQALADADKHQFQLWALSMLDNAVPYKGGKKGADKGVDGYVYFQAPSAGGAGSKTVTGKAIVSVKGGANVSDTMVKDLITTVEHEGAQMGLFITLASPTRPMVTRAAAAGFYEAGGRSYPKVQIFTIEELFEGKRPQMPWLDPSVFKKARRETTPAGQGDLGL